MCDRLIATAAWAGSHVPGCVTIFSACFTKEWLLAAGIKTVVEGARKERGSGVHLLAYVALLRLARPTEVAMLSTEPAGSLWNFATSLACKTRVTSDVVTTMFDKTPLLGFGER